MGLVMVCPQCQAKVLLQSQNCPYCQADLRNVPQDQRRYVVGQPGPSTPPAASAPAATEAIPVLASAGVPETTSQPAAPEAEKNPAAVCPAVCGYACLGPHPEYC